MSPPPRRRSPKWSSNAVGRETHGSTVRTAADRLTVLGSSEGGAMPTENEPVESHERAPETQLPYTTLFRSNGGGVIMEERPNPFTNQSKSTQLLKPSVAVPNVAPATTTVTKVVK